MKYIFPKISNCLIYEENGTDNVEITDILTDEQYCVSYEAVKFMKQLDGKTDPYRIKTSLTEEEIDCLIDELEKCELLKESNKIADGGTVLKSLWEPKWTNNFRMISRICNKMLMLLWLPALIAGVLLFKNNCYLIDYDMSWLGYIVGLLTGIILHEFGHAFAGAAYGARVFEMGFLRMYYIIPGAYVLLDDKAITERMKRIQVNAAGVEMNLLLTGIFLILGAIFVKFGGLFLYAAIQNVFLAIFNLMLIEGLDGMAILSEALGINDFIDVAQNVAFNRQVRSDLSQCGIIGITTVVACYMACFLQLAMPVFLILNVLEVVVCFV